MLIPMPAPKRARFLALGLLCCLATSCASTDSSPELVPTAPVNLDALSYSDEYGIALDWLGESGLAVVAEPKLTVLDLSAGGAVRWELDLEPCIWPIEAIAGADLLAVCYPEQRIEIYQLDENYQPVPSAEPETLGAIVPSVTIAISSLAGAPFDQTEPSPRLVFAMRGDGDLVAMMGPDGNVTFGNPRTGWPNPIVSIRLPKDCDVPIAARFRGAGSVAGAEGEMVVTGSKKGGGIVEWALNAELTRWSSAAPLVQLGAEDATGAMRVAQAGSMLECRGADGELLWSEPLGNEVVGGLAVGANGAVVLAQGGKLRYLKPHE